MFYLSISSWSLGHAYALQSSPPARPAYLRDRTDPPWGREEGRNVPVPGGPYNNTPLGGLMPTR